MRTVILAIVAAIAVSACRPDHRGLGIDLDRAMAHVEALATIGPRPPGSPAAQKAIAYIEGELGKLELTSERLPVGTVQLPAITVLGNTYRDAMTRTTTDPNLVVRFGPPG